MWLVHRRWQAGNWLDGYSTSPESSSGTVVLPLQQVLLASIMFLRQLAWIALTSDLQDCINGCDDNDVVPDDEDDYDHADENCDTR